MEKTHESDVIEHFLHAVEYFAVGIEALAVGIIVVWIVVATYSYFSLRRSVSREVREAVYRERLARTLLLGLELLVAADIVRTVAIEPTLESVGVLGLLVLIRTFLSWALVVETEHRWPWQQERDPETQPIDQIKR